MNQAREAYKAQVRHLRRQIGRGRQGYLEARANDNAFASAAKAVLRSRGVAVAVGAATSAGGALAHAGHGAAVAMHLHPVELVALALLAIVVGLVGSYLSARCGART